jgi:hypothetical protein
VRKVEDNGVVWVKFAGEKEGGDLGIFKSRLFAEGKPVEEIGGQKEVMSGNSKNLTDQEQLALKNEAKGVAHSRTEKYGNVEFSEDRPLQNFYKLLSSKIRSDKRFRGNKALLAELFHESKDEISALMERKITEVLARSSASENEREASKSKP